jgi:hypothetical protein
MTTGSKWCPKCGFGNLPTRDKCRACGASIKQVIEQPPTGSTSAEPQDFDRGFGIGGINRYQPTAAEEMEHIEAKIRYADREARRVRRGPLPNGQLWEPCPICRREPVCVDCGLCEKHCDC